MTGNEKAQQCRNSRLQMFFKRGVFNNFAKFTGKRLYWSFFFNKVAKFVRRLFLKKPPVAASESVHSRAKIKTITEWHCKFRVASSSVANISNN